MKLNKLKQFAVSIFLSLVMMATVMAPFAHAYRRQNDFSSAIGPLFVIILIWIVLFLICREIYCWYSKINLRIKIHHEQTEILKEICRAVGGKLPAAPPDPADKP